MSFFAASWRGRPVGLLFLRWFCATAGAAAVLLPALASFTAEASAAAASNRADGKTEQEKPKLERKPAPPQLLLALPLAGRNGQTNHLKLRGLHLTNVTEVRIYSSPPSSVHPDAHASPTRDDPANRAIVRSAGPAEVPKELDAKRVGDSLVEADLFLPAAAGPATNWLVLVNADGSSEARPWPVLPADRLREEKEPNGGFKRAQLLEPGTTLQGVIKESGDVDVFRWLARTGVRYRVSLCAAALGSPLDASVTVFDARGHPQAAADDAERSLDPVLSWRAPADAEYYLSVFDALDKGSSSHCYLLEIMTE